MAAEQQQLTPGTLLQGGKYRIEQSIGQGGFGITYLASQTSLGRRVAIKEFFMKDFCQRVGETTLVQTVTNSSAETVTRFREKFAKEARNIAQLNHPNIVRVIDIFDENDTVYYAMDYAQGGSLSDKLKAHGPFSEEQAIRFLMPVANALGYIHSRQMAHLDVKPANIILDDKGCPLLIDFGMSKQYDAASGSQTSTTPVGISEGYAPPEQYNRGGVCTFSPESDVYALAATFYKLVTGVTPLPSIEVRDSGLPLGPLQSHGVRPSTIALLRQIMECRRVERPKSPIAFIDQLASATTPQPTPVPSRPAPAPPRSAPIKGKPGTPSPAPKSSAASVIWSFLAFVVLAAVGMFVYFDYQNRHDTDEARYELPMPAETKSYETREPATRTEEVASRPARENRVSAPAEPNFSSGTFEGKVDGKYEVVVTLTRNGRSLYGNYYYKSTMRKQGNVPATYISLSGSIEEDGTFLLYSTFVNDSKTDEQWKGRIQGNYLQARSYGTKYGMIMEATM